MKKITQKDRYPDDRYNYQGMGNRYRPDDRYPDYNSIGGGGSRYRPNEDRYAGMFPPTRRIPPRYPSRYPDNSISGDGRYYPENRYPDNRPDSRYPESDGRYYPTTVTGTRYPTSDNRFPVGNERNPIFILKYGNGNGNNRYGGSGGSGSGSGKVNFCIFFSSVIWYF